MKTSTTAKTQLEAEPLHGVSPDLIRFRQEYSTRKTKTLLKWQAGNHNFEVRAAGQSLWIHVRGPAGMQVALRAGHCIDGGFANCQVKSDDHSADFWLAQPSGKYRIHIELPSKRLPLVHWTLWFAPSDPLLLPSWPRDVYPLGENGDPLTSRGDVHVTQRGPRSGILFLSMLRPCPGSLLYFQNLTSLNDYSEKTHTAPTNTVGGQWPELGFTPTPTTNQPLPADQEVILSDAYVCFSRSLPQDDATTSELFLDLLAQVYLQIPQPDAAYHHWPHRAERALFHLTHSPLCTRDLNGHRYINPYVGATGKPPESLVQLSIITALSAYTDWKQEKSPLLDALIANLPGFYDPSLPSINRWLLGEPFPEDDFEEFSDAGTMDSWYLYHILGNLGYLAQHGNASAKKLFLQSLDYAIKVAHRFDYQWPVFFDLQSLEIRRAEVAPGEGGENDVAGLYCRAMLIAWELTSEKRYLEEAKKAAHKLDGIGFNLAYQLNNTVLGGLAMIKLWKITGDPFYKGLGLVCLANLFQHVWLWECRYGNAKYYSTFFGILPLKEAPYLALFEEFEVPSVLEQLMALGSDDLPDSVKLLTSELCRHSLSRAWMYYPSELPEEIISTKPQTGQIERGLDIPLEDFYEGWQKPGQVGQEVYGAGAPFTFVVRHYHPVEGAPFLLFCDYPITNLVVKNNSKGATLRFRIGGDKRLNCRVRLIPNSAERLNLDEVEFSSTTRTQPYKGLMTPDGQLEFNPSGAEAITLKWKRASKQGQRSKSKK